VARLKAQKKNRQIRSDDHASIDTRISTVESSVALTHAAGSDPPDDSRKLYSTVKQAQEILTSLQNEHGLSPTFFTPLPSNQAIEQEYADTHNGEKPSTETLFREVAKRARESLSPPKVHKGSAGVMPRFSKGESTRWSPRDLKSANRKIADPDNNPKMTPQEVMAYLQLGKSAVYEHPDLQRVSTGRRKVLFTTKSVIAVMDAAA
jgi:hypothetical protein